MPDRDPRWDQHLEGAEVSRDSHRLPHAVLPRRPHPIVRGEGVIYWNWPSHPWVRGTTQFPLGSCCPAVSCIVKHYTWNGTCTTERRERMGILFCLILPPVCLLTLDNDASPSQHVWFVQLHQIPKAAATLAYRDQSTSVVLAEEEDLPIKVSTKYLSFWL